MSNSPHRRLPQCNRIEQCIYHRRQLEQVVVRRAQVRAQVGIAMAQVGTAMAQVGIAMAQVGIAMAQVGIVMVVVLRRSACLVLGLEL